MNCDKENLRKEDRMTDNTDRRSGSVTISMRPAPALFKSILDVRLRELNVDLAVSCRLSSINKFNAQKKLNAPALAESA